MYVEDKFWDPCMTCNSQDLFNNIHEDVLELGARELLLEGGVAEYLLFVPDLLNGDLLQNIRVVSAYRE